MDLNKFPEFDAIDLLNRNHHSSEPTATTSINLRQANKNDLPNIQKLINCETEFYFGSSIKLDTLLETTMYPSVILNENNYIIGFICFNVTVNIPALNASYWLDWINANYKVPNIHYYNTIFIEYFVFDPSFNNQTLLVNTIFKEIFLCMQDIENIILVQPPLKNKNSEFLIYSDFLGKFSTQYARYSSSPSSSGNMFYKLYVFNNYNFLPPLQSRLAVPENNDMIVKILDLKYPHLKKNFGEFYVAEEILKNSNDKKFILLERNDDEIYGVALVNRIVDVNYLSKNFDLSLINNLKKIDDSIAKKEIDVNYKNQRYSSDNFVITENQRTSQLKTISKSDMVKGVERKSITSLSKLLMALDFDTDDTDTASRNSNAENIHEFSESHCAENIDYNRNFDFTNKNILTSAADEINAFAIELFASNSTILDSKFRLHELIKSAFSLFPDIDYCVFLKNTMESIDPLQQYFSLIPPQPQSNSNSTLYISRRETIINKIIGSEATIEDLHDIRIFLKIDSTTTCKEVDSIFELIMNSLYNCQKIYGVICLRTFHRHTLIGIVILSVETQIHILRKYFNLDSLIMNLDVVRDQQQHGRILYLLLYPLFDCNSKLIFREISRLTGFTFYYTIENSETPPNVYNNLLDSMYPVEPNFIYNIFKKDNTKELITPLYFRSLNNSQISLLNIDTKICCLGFDGVCKGFIKQLIFDPKYINYKFTNITVITEPGTFESKTTDVYYKICKLININDYTSPEYIKRMGLNTWVSFVCGRLVAIDRNSKMVLLNHSMKIKYDYLFLVCSIDYGYPTNLKWNSIYSPPSNFEVTNDVVSSTRFYYKLMVLKDFFTSGFEIIVYGSVLMTYTCLQFLLENGIPGNWIHFVLLEVKQEDEMNIDGFDDDEYIRDLIFDELKKANINIYLNYRFVNWQLYEDTNIIKSITFQSKFNIVTLPCKLFVCFCRKSLSLNHKNIFHKCGLIIDGRLVIDENFKMNDPYIYAAGPITQYKRALFANNLDHKYFHRFEIGQTLGNKFCNQLINKNAVEECYEMSHFYSPIIQCTFLPGGYQYVKIQQCGPILQRTISKLFPFLGKNYTFIRKYDLIEVPSDSDFTNASCKKLKSEYFRIQFRSNGFARNLVCLTKQTDISLRFLGKLFTMNEKLLNNFIKRYNTGKIIDPLEFLTQTWIEVLLYPGFTKIQNKNLEIMMKTLMKNSFTNNILKNCIQGMEGNCLSVSERKSIRNLLDREDVKRALELNILKFINNRHYDFPTLQYCQTDVKYFENLLEKY